MARYFNLDITYFSINIFKELVFIYEKHFIILR